MTTRLHFAVGRIDEACELVERHHYSGRSPGNVRAVGTWHADGGLFGDRGDAVAACFFSSPPTRWSEEVLELSRLVRVPDCSVPLTGLIAATVGFIRRDQISDLLVSFADWTQRHHGGIYQAASWSYAGRRERNMDGLLIDGVFIPGRSCNALWGTRSPTRWAERMDEQRIEAHFDEGKHLYWRAIGRSGKAKASRLGLNALPYPKPNADVEEAA